MKRLIILLFLSVVPFLAQAERWVGRAATYQPLEGSTTTAGQQFDSTALTAACNGYKMNSTVIVTNVQTGKQIKVRVNDRIDTGSQYFILLSPAAAKEIGMLWDTGLVVVDAGFNDINSTERLAINGLVPEGKIDDETLKSFPKADWGVADNMITKKIFEKADDVKKTDSKDDTLSSSSEKPRDRLLEIPDKISSKEGLSGDSGNFVKEKSSEEKTETTLVPKNEVVKFPSRLSKYEILNKDGLDGKRFEKKDQPKLKNINNPNQRFAKESLSFDTGSYKKFERLLEPKPDKLKIPRRYSNNNLIAEDISKTIPHNDLTKTPAKRGINSYLSLDSDTVSPRRKNLLFPERITEKKLIGSDNDENQPSMVKVKNPEKNRNVDLLSTDFEENTPKYAKVINPETLKVTRTLSSDVDENAPDYSKSSIPETNKVSSMVSADIDENAPDYKKTVKPKNYEKNELISEYSISEKNPNAGKEFLPLKKSDKEKMSGDYDAPKIVKGTNEVNWMSTLDADKSYIKFSTSFDRIEGERRYNLFKQVFSGVVGYKAGNRYILLIKPDNQATLPAILNQIRSLGYKDAYIVN